MNKKRNILLISLGLTFAVAVATVVAFDYVSNKTETTNKKSAYQLYKESHPDYNKSEEEWLEDLVNGKLGDKEKYTVTFNSNGGSKVNPQVVLEGEKIKEPTKPTRLGYTFKEWTYQGSPWIFYGFVVTSDMQLDASWVINNYSITYNLNGGSITGDNPTKYTVESEYEFISPEKFGYTFGGWYDSNNNKIESISKGTTGNLSLTAHWNPNKNILSITSDDSSKGSTSIISGEGYTGEEIVVKAIPGSEFYFKGWFENDELISKEETYSFIMPSNDYSLVAKFDESRILTLNISEPAKGEVSGAGEYIIGDTVNISCEVNSGYFKGWYCNDELVSSFKDYTFSMPSENYELTAVFVPDDDEEEYLWKINHGVIPYFSDDLKTVTYGMYPKSVVDDHDIIEQLNQLEDVPDYVIVELNRDYYLRKRVSIYDFSRLPDAEGIDVPKKFDNNEEMINNSFRWFKVEPITWDIIKYENNKFSLISHNLIEKGQVHTSSATRTIDGKKIYANNYEYSYVRKWLDSDFYSQVFDLDDSYVITTEVDNSDISTGSEGNIYASDTPTLDKVYLPSVQEINNLPSHIDKICKSTDYLRASGVCYDFSDNLYCCDYWTRSPDDDPAYKDLTRRYSYNGWYGRCSSSLTHCYRPCLTIAFK